MKLKITHRDQDKKRKSGAHKAKVIENGRVEHCDRKNKLARLGKGGKDMGTTSTGV